MTTAGVCVCVAVASVVVICGPRVAANCNDKRWTIASCSGCVSATAWYSVPS